MRRKILTFITIGILGTMSVIALGSEMACIEPVHAPPEVRTSVIQTDSLETLDNKIKLSGQVNPNNSPTTAWFEYGETESTDNYSGFVYVGDGEEVTEVKIFTKEIKPNTIYFYRLVSENEYGVSYGKIKTITTPEIN